MSRRQLVTLFICIMIPFVSGNAQIGLLPIYLTRLGVEPASIGNDLALIFLAVVVGSIAAGWLSERFQRRKPLFIGVTAVSVPLSWLLSQTTQVDQFIILMVIIALLGGISTAMVNILAGLFAADTERGKVFGMLGVAVNVGTMLGGLLVGVVVQRWGFSTLFALAATLSLVAPVTGCFLEDKVAVSDRSRVASTAQTRPILGTSFYGLLAACLLLNASGAFTGMGRPLIMDRLGFDSTAIASVITVGGAVGIPVPLVLGWLSDRLGRFRLLVLSFLAAGASVALLTISIALWHYWLAALLAAGLGAGNAVASALVADRVPPQGLSKALSWLNAVNWAGGVVGYTVTGYIIGGFGLTTTFLVGGSLPVLGILLLLGLRSFRPGQAPDRSSEASAVPMAEQVIGR